MGRKMTQRALVALVSIAASGAASAAATVSGNVAFQGSTWPVADAIAFADGEDLSVVLAQQKFDRAELAKDGKLDDFDVLRHDGDTITLRVDPENEVGCLNFSAGGGGGSSCNSEYARQFKLVARDGQHIAGTFTFDDDGKTSVVKFDVPIETTITRPGKALPADGGEPGKAVLAHFAAIASGDFERIKAGAHPERVKMMEDAGKSGEARQMIEMLKMMTPTDVKITGGTVDGERATIDFTGKDGSGPVKGTADVERYQGKWYVTGTST